MGIVMKLLTLPVMGPIQGVVWLAEKISEQVDNEVFNEEKVRGKLMELELRYDMGEIAEEDYLAIETELLTMMRVIRERKAAGLQ